MRPASREGLQFFSLEYHRGWACYLAHFPIRRGGTPRFLRNPVDRTHDERLAVRVGIGVDDRV